MRPVDQGNQVVLMSEADYLEWLRRTEAQIRQDMIDYPEEFSDVPEAKERGDLA